MKKLRNYIFILSISIFVGLAALFIVYLLPTDRMEANVRSSIDIFYTESVYPQQAKGYKSSQLDNETDAIMLLDAIHPAPNVLRSKMRCVFPELRFPILRPAAST